MASDGVGWLTRVLRRLRPTHLAFGAAGVALVSILSFVLATSIGSDEAPSGLLEADAEAHGLSPLAIDAQGIADSDLDGVSDSFENFVHGTDPNRWNTSGSRIPDGWLVRYGYDPLDPGIGQRAAAVPPADSLPPAYGNEWPSAYTATLEAVYTLGRPAGWDEATQGVFDNRLDPTRWDNNADGIADGFLLHHGLDPLDGNVSHLFLAGPEGLDVRQAYEHLTDPRSLDTDRDGIRDRDEVEGPPNLKGGSVSARFPPTRPDRWDTSGGGVCDGFLAAHGLEPTRPESAYGDVDHDGATTRDEFLWSRERFGQAACDSGQGLDPRAQSTAGAPVPDGWLIRHGLSPLEAGVTGKVTQKASTDAGPPKGGSGNSTSADVVLTVLDEYRFGRPSDWKEPSSGPWWGGTDPTKPDTDGDGLGDAWEQRGYAVSARTELGNGTVRTYATGADPTRADTDGDGLIDGEEAYPNLRQPAWRSLPPTDARRPDTDFDGLHDADEFRLALGLDPTRADSAGDLLRDGARYQYLANRSRNYGNAQSYEFPGAPNTTRSVKDWAEKLPGAARYPILGAAELAALTGPRGDIDGDNRSNVLDSDMDNDTLLNGWEVQPSLYARSDFGLGPLTTGRPATDPLNPDTDGDLLFDGWEVEFGLANFTLKRYNLDPSLWDSDSDGKDDSREDPDQDSITWYSFSSPTKRNANLYNFTNLLEQQFERDPNRFDTDKDGLGDGWKVFWSLVYPRLTANSTPGPGIYYPGAPNALQVPAGAAAPIVRLSQPANASGAVLQNPTYERFVLTTATMLLSESERGPSMTVPSVDGANRTVHRVRGNVPFLLHTAQAIRTNPYLLDTDGDQMPDWWEHLHGRKLPGTSSGDQDVAGCVDGRGPDPTTSDGAQDLDDDELTNLQEYRAVSPGGLARSDPLCRDTDLGGIQDGEELLRRGLDPALPTDDRSVLDQRADADTDGLLDFEELTGRTYPYLGALPIRTDPHNPDTDGDGLLDGASVPPRTSSQGLLGSSALAKRFIDLGIAYEARIVGANREYFFHGESEWSADPRDPDDSGTGAPAGWLVAHGLAPTASTPSYAAHYDLAKPRWWNQSAHGPWWGGADPQVDGDTISGLQRDNDLDKDGLLDSDGGDLYEDPMPAANHLNAFRDVDWAGHAAPPPSTLDPSDPSLSLSQRRLLGQAYLNPRRIGERFVERDPTLSDNFQRTTPTLCVEALPTGTVLTKGTPLLLKGRVVNGTCAAGAPLAGVAVEARMGLPTKQAFGAAFTGADGNFTLPVNVSQSHRVAIPANAGILRGNATGSVPWTTDPSLVAPGLDREILVRTYTTPATPPFTTKVPALRSTFEPVPVRVQAGSVLRLDVTPVSLTGHPLDVTVELRDSGGAPLTDRVVLEWDGQSFDIHPRASDGGGQRQLPPVPLRLAGLQTLRAKSFPASGDVTRAEAEAEIRLLRPATVRLDGLPSSADAGQLVLVRGLLESHGDVAHGAAVTVNLTSAGSTVVAAPAVATAPTGRFEARLQLPATLPYGTYVVTVTAGPTATTAGVQTNPTLRIRSLPRFADVSLGNLTLGDAALVAGRLLEPDGQPIPDAPLSATLAGRGAASTQTDAQGRFLVSPEPPAAAGAALQSLEFPGDANHAPARHQAERGVLTPSRLAVASGTVGRGLAAFVPVQLQDASGNAIAGAPVTIRWGGEPSFVALTDSRGTAMLARPGSPNDGLGPVVVRARYDGSLGGGRAANESAAVWVVTAAAQLELPGGSFDAGTRIPPGLLRDPAKDAPLDRSVLTLHINDGPGREARTDGDGRFEVVPPTTPEADPVTLRVQALFAGNTSYGPAQARGTIRIRSPVDLQLSAPETVVAGRPTWIYAHLDDARGRRVEGGTLNATFRDAVVGEATVVDGSARLSLRLPADAPPGQADVRLSYSGTDTHGAVSTPVRTRVVAPTEMTLKLQAARPGEFSTVDVTVEAAGRPVPNAQVVLQVEGMAGGLVATTDEEGVATFHVVQGASSARMVARFPGDGAFSPTSTHSVLEPVTPPNLVRRGLTALAWTALALAVAGAAAAYATYRLRRHPLEPALKRIRRTLLARGEYEKQILMAYQILEDVAIAREMISESARTPRLLEEALARGLPPQSRPSLGRLIALFEDARYGHAELGSGHRDAAVGALDELVAELSRQGSEEFRSYRLKRGIVG